MTLQKKHLLAVTLAAGLVLAGCGGKKESSSSGSSSSANAGVAGSKIALLLPEKKTARYETADKPFFEAKFKQLCATCQVLYSNAEQDVAMQVKQAEQAIAAGIKVLVLDPVDSASAGAIADKAKAANIPVVAYDRLVLNSDGVKAYISFDNEKVGQLQAQALVERLKDVPNPKIVMINGSPSDNNAGQFKRGAHSVFDPLVQSGKLTIVKEYDTPDWSPDKAQAWMKETLAGLGDTKLDGVYAANDGTGGGAIAAMKSAGITKLPPVTGQDAELAAIQRVVSGEQHMTVYKAIKPEAEAAAEVTYALLTNNMQSVTSKTEGKKTANGKADVPSVLLTPIVVTKGNVKDTIVKDQFWKAEQICTTAFAAACKEAGINTAS